MVVQASLEQHDLILCRRSYDLMLRLANGFDLDQEVTFQWGRTALSILMSPVGADRSWIEEAVDWLVDVWESAASLLTSEKFAQLLSAEIGFDVRPTIGAHLEMYRQIARPNAGA